jgi:hypothetical protein
VRVIVRKGLQTRASIQTTHNEAQQTSLHRQKGWCRIVVCNHLEQSADSALGKPGCKQNSAWANEAATVCRQKSLTSDQIAEPARHRAALCELLKHQRSGNASAVENRGAGHQQTKLIRMQRLQCLESGRQRRLMEATPELDEQRTTATDHVVKRLQSGTTAPFADYQFASSFGETDPDPVAAAVRPSSVCTCHAWLRDEPTI